MLTWWRKSSPASVRLALRRLKDSEKIQLQALLTASESGDSKNSSNNVYAQFSSIQHCTAAKKSLRIFGQKTEIALQPLRLLLVGTGLENTQKAVHCSVVGEMPKHQTEIGSLWTKLVGQQLQQRRQQSALAVAEVAKRSSKIHTCTNQNVLYFSIARRNHTPTFLTTFACQVVQRAKISSFQVLFCTWLHIIKTCSVIYMVFQKYV